MTLDKKKFVICSNCGEKNSPDSSYCKKCGAKLSSSRGKRNSSEKSNLKKDSDKYINNQKYISSAKVVFIVVGLLLIVGIMMVLSGQLDSPEVKPKKVPQNNQITEQHNGADLNTLNEIKALEDKFNKNPKDLNTLLKLAHKLNDSGFYDRAITHYKEYLASKPNDVDVLVDMGVCFFQLKDNKNAIKWIEKAVSLKPDHQIGNFNLGIVNFSANNIKQAKKWWKKAIEIDPNSRIGKKAKELLEKN